MTACVDAAMVGDALAAAWWLLFATGLAVLVRRQVVVQRRRPRDSWEYPPRRLDGQR